MLYRVVVSLWLVVPLLAAPLLGQSRAMDVNGVTLPYEVTGTGPPLVLIHGWAVNRTFWDDDVAALAKHFRVIRYDRRGFGAASGKPDFTADPADLKDLLAALGVERAHVMGHSQGAGVALTFALRFPEMVDRLILFGAGPPAGLDLPPPTTGDMLQSLAEIGQTYGIDSLRAAIMERVASSFGGPPSPEIARRGMAFLQAYRGQDLIDPAPPSGLVAPATLPELGAVRAPTLVLLGDDEMPPVRLAADVFVYAIPDARKIVIPDAGHVANWNEPERFAAEVIRFLR